MNQTNELTASFYRCRNHDVDGSFVDSFYDIFLSKSPEISAMFANTDFDRQKLMLRQSLLEVICFDLGMSGTREELQRIGKRHRELNVTDQMYEMWLDSLCEAIAKHDPQFTPDLETRWRTAMEKAIAVMTAQDDGAA